MKRAHVLLASIYPVSSIYVGSVNMEGTDAAITLTNGTTYTIAIPPSGTRMINLPAPITIRTVAVSADGVDEEAVHNASATALAQPDARLFVGYVPSSCSASGASPSLSCPATSTYRASIHPGVAIPDSTYRQSVSSTIGLPVNGTLTSLSVSVDIAHTYRGDLKVVLTSPGGTQVTLHNRQGGSSDNLRATYTTNFASLAGSQIRGDWVLTVGDYARADVGTLREWSLAAAYTPPPPPAPPATPVPTTSSTVLFSDNFESGSLAKWVETGEGDWRILTSQSQYVPTAPGHARTNMVLHSDNCDSSCTVTLRTAIDLSSYSSATLSFWRFVDTSLDAGEYLRVDLYDGTRWTTVYNWVGGIGDGPDDGRWHLQTYSLSQYMDSTAFKMRIVTREGSSAEDVQIDDIMINATSSTAPSPTPAPAPTPAPSGSYSVYVADSDDKEVLVFSQSGAYQGTMVPRQSAGLGRVWDVAFGPDGHLYASDNTNKKIRKYNGATGSPISPSASGWASTTKSPYGMTWKGSTLYVATAGGIERFSSSGTSLGYFGDARFVPGAGGSRGTLFPYDVAFCPDNRMYVADRLADKIYIIHDLLWVFF